MQPLPVAPAPVALETAPRRRRSVFGNYAPSDESGTVVDPASPPAARPGEAADRAGIERALARLYVHQWLARAFDHPAPATWAWLASDPVQVGLAAAVARIEPGPARPIEAARRSLAERCRPAAFDRFHDDYIAVIGHAARGSCPVNEIEYGDLKADPLFQPHRLADLAAFYRAFGLEMDAGSGERQDHLSVELEFMGVLAAQEAAWLGGQPGSEPGGDALAVCREAQREFLREHLGRWTPAFARRLERAVGDGPLGALARFTLEFIQAECQYCGVRPGSEDLLLRPADPVASLCDGCGLTAAQPEAPAGGGSP
jgi:DMSO reductase family type II enzyme chaperone